MAIQRLDGIFRATRGIAAGRWQDARWPHLPAARDPDKDVLHRARSPPPGLAAWRAAVTRGLAIAYPIERADQIGLHRGKVARHRLAATDQHMIGSGQSPIGEHLVDHRAEAALDAVAHNRVADLLGDGIADALLRVVVRTLLDQQHERRCPDPKTAVGREEIGALTQHDGRAGGLRSARR